MVPRLAHMAMVSPRTREAHGAPTITTSSGINESAWGRRIGSASATAFPSRRSPERGSPRSTQCFSAATSSNPCGAPSPATSSTFPLPAKVLVRSTTPPSLFRATRHGPVRGAGSSPQGASRGSRSGTLKCTGPALSSMPSACS